MIVLLLLLVSALASPPPVPWYCDDEGLAGELSAALDTFWKEGPVEVRVGLPREGASIHYEDGSLVLRSQARHLESPAPRDPATLVLLARSWSTELEHIQEEGWVPEIDLPRPPPPLEPPPPPVPRPLGYAWDLGLGVRDTATEPATHEGTRLVGRVFVGHVGLEADLYLAGASSQRVSSLERALLDLFADAKPEGGEPLPVPLVRDTTSLTTTLTLGPDPTKRGQGLRGGPFVHAGLEVRRYAVYSALVDPEAGEVYVQADARHGWAVGPAGGAGIELWLGRVGLRVSASERAAIPLVSDSTFSEGVRLDPTLTVDLLLSGV